MGELLSVSEAEGEHLAELGIPEPFPFRPLTPFVSTFPACGDSFWFEFAPHQKGSPHGELARRKP